jgi:hypothetical protein
MTTKYSKEFKESIIRKLLSPCSARVPDVAKEKIGKFLKKRTSVYEAAKAKRPERWSKKCRNWNMVKMVTLNPNKSSKSKAGSVDKAALTCF